MTELIAGKAIGVPRALLFYSYGRLWTEFLGALGLSVRVSEDTSRRTLDLGVEACVDEACLPVKLFFGHALSLARTPRLDYLFVPRMVSVERGAFICPKLMGLPDMLAPVLPATVRVVAPTMDEGLLGKAGAMRRFLSDVNTVIGCSYRKANAAFRQGIKAQAEQDRRRQVAPSAARDGGGTSDGPAIAVAGHPYLVADDYASLGTVRRLKAAGCTVLTCESFDPAVLDAEAAGLPKAIFWTISRRIVALAMLVLRAGLADGLLYLGSFACGPDSIAAAVIESEVARKPGFPYMAITVDEHTAAAGLETRLEAFLDMVHQSKITGIRGERRVRGRPCG